MAIRFFSIALLQQICGFAGLFIVLFIISGTPLSLLVQRKLQRKHTKAGRRKSPRLAIHPSARRRSFLLIIRCRAGRRSARAPIEMFRSGNTGSVSDEARGKRFFALRPQNDKRRKRISQSVILSVSEESFHSAQIRIFCIRHCEAPQGAVAIRFFRISHLRQICGFAGFLLYFLSFQELRFLPLWEESSKEAHEGGEREISPPCDPPLCAPEWSSFDDPPPRRTPICLAPIEMFRSGNMGSISDEEPRYAVPAMFLWLPCAKGAVARRRLKD